MYIVGHYWTHKEIKLLKEQVDKHTNKELAKMFNVTKISIEGVLKRHRIIRIHRSSKWKIDKIQFIKNNINKYTKIELAKILNITVHNLKTVMYRNKIKKIRKAKKVISIKNGDCLECISHYINSGGYPLIYYKSKTQILARYIYEQYYHAIIPQGYCIRHTCDNKLCINPLHLIIGTLTDNMKDKKERNRVKGSKNPNSKLNEEQVKEIRIKLKQGMLGTIIAKEYNVKSSVIYDIKSGRRWGWLK